MSQPIRGQGGHIVFAIGPNNTNLVEDVSSCQVSLNSVQQFQRRSRKCLSQSEARAAILFFRSAWKTQLCRGHWDLASCQVSLNSVQRFQRSRKCLSQSEARAAIFFFPTGPKNTNLVEDVEILLPVKFCWILFIGFREEVENVSANQRLGRPSCFSDRPEKHKLGRGCWDLASCQVSLNSVQWFQRRSWKCESLRMDDGWTDDERCAMTKCLSQSEAGAAILFFRWAQKTQTWWRTLRSCFLSSFVEFRSAVSDWKSKMSRPIKGLGSHLVYLMGQKNTYLVGNV